MTKEAKPVDLATFDEAMQRQNEGILIPIKSMDRKTPLGFSIRVAGPDSQRAIDAQERLADERLEKEELEPPGARELAERNARYVAMITMGFEPNVILDGEELSYTEENALKLYRRFPFIFEQVNRGADRSRFTKG